MRVIVSGGGTGGHINPAIAIAKYIKEIEPDSEILYVGTEHGLEKKLVPAQDIEIKYIDVYGFKRKLSPQNIYIAYKAVKAIGDSKKILSEFKPDVVIGTGGYVCGPLLQAAVKMKIPTLIHEQNVIPGMTVKMLADKVDIVATSFDTTKNYLKKHKKIVLTGNPVRADLLKVTRYEARIKFNLDEKPTVLFMGGSLGARSINNALVEIVSKNMAEDYNIIASTGERNYDEVMSEIKKTLSEIPANITIQPYIFNTDVAFAAADIIICRTGAITVSELAATGKPSIVVPSPNVAHNHQEYNARYLSDRGAAVLIHDDELTGLKLNAEILALINNQELLADMSKNAKTVAIYDATDKIYTAVKSLLEN
ncbi:MAG: undecaprenyldiphospho-muramoylpentapeptide beta-N-acetylglucosaminyltransferase [Clostridia bacterium]|nr:undecaprenyldiphospho-muramoylpentapeptide beta-N-acetylglucosaminyltransferase [Clostridia bacterium]